MTRSQYSKVKKGFINWVNHWNIVEEDVVQGPMRVVYSELKNVENLFGVFVATLMLLVGVCYTHFKFVSV